MRSVAGQHKRLLRCCSVAAWAALRGSEAVAEMSGSVLPRHLRTALAPAAPSASFTPKTTTRSTQRPWMPSRTVCCRFFDSSLSHSYSLRWRRVVIGPVVPAGLRSRGGTRLERPRRPNSRCSTNTSWSPQNHAPFITVQMCDSPRVAANWSTRFPVPSTEGGRSSSGPDNTGSRTKPANSWRLQRRRR